MSRRARANWTGLSLVMVSSVVTSYPGLLLSGLVEGGMGGPLAGLLMASTTGAAATVAAALAARCSRARRIAAAFVAGTAAYLVFLLAFPLGMMLSPLSFLLAAAAPGFLFGAGLDRLLRVLFPGKGAALRPSTPLRWLFALVTTVGGLLLAASFYSAVSGGTLQGEEILWVVFLTCALMQTLTVALILRLLRLDDQIAESPTERGGAQ